MRSNFSECLGVTYLMAPASSGTAALLRHFSSSRYLRNFVFLAISADLTLVHFFFGSRGRPPAPPPPAGEVTAPAAPSRHSPLRLRFRAPWRPTPPAADRQLLLWLLAAALLLLPLMWMWLLLMLLLPWLVWLLWAWVTFWQATPTLQLNSFCRAAVAGEHIAVDIDVATGFT